MADALVAAGVKRIEGRLVGHEGAFTGDRRGGDWTWEDLAWGYGTEVSALSFEDNVVDAALAPGEREGDPAWLDVAPAGDTLAVRARSTTAPAGAPEDVRLEREPATNAVTPLGLGADRRDVGAASWRWPTRRATRPRRFARRARREGRPRHGRDRDDPRAAARRRARPRRARVARRSPRSCACVNKESQNLHAEMLLRLVGLKAEGRGQRGEGARGGRSRCSTGSACRTRAGGSTDGSGLARTDLVTPHGLVALLAAMDRHPAAAAFRDSLPVAGRDGTLEKRMRGTAAEGNVTAKTGTLVARQRARRLRHDARAARGSRSR